MKETKTDKVMVRLDRKTYKKLQQIKLDQDIRSISDVITMLVEEEAKYDDINKKEALSQAIRNATI